MLKLCVVGMIVLLGCANADAATNTKFTRGAWVPYWVDQGHEQAILDKLHFFDEISPFAFEVNPDGSLADTLKLNGPFWKELLDVCRKNHIKIIPTLLWTDAPAMHFIFSNPQRRREHIANILKLADQNGFTGIDIDYEGKDLQDKGLFSSFIQELSALLKSKGYLLYVTLEPRTSDFVHHGWKGVQAMAWANDYAVMNRYCDKVRIMAYDQFVQTKGGKIWTDRFQESYVPNADIAWVEEVIAYSLRNIDHAKIVLGIPTYAWDFVMSGREGDWQIKCFQSLSFAQAMELAQAHKIIPWRNAGGELSLSFDEAGLRHLITVSDSVGIQMKIALARKYGLNGIVFFKLDGKEIGTH